MPNGKIIQLQNFLEKLDVIRKKYEDIEAQKDQFNIFSTLLDPSDEVNLHSQFIYSLLNLKTRNEFLYLNAFLKTIKSEFEYHNNSLEIFKELHDIDILIIDKSTKNAIILENKIYASDSNHEKEGQLEKYYRIVNEEEKISEDKIEVLYLTLDGHEPSVESISTSKKHPNLSKKIQCISYPNEIIKWLQCCMLFIYDKPFQRETILQYIKLINDMTNNVDIEERVEIKKLLGESKSNLESAKLLIDNVNHLHWHTIADFWNGLAEFLEKHGYEVIQKPTEESFTDIVHGSKRKKNNAGLMIDIKTKHPFIIRLEEYSDITFNFGVIKEKKMPNRYVKAFKTLVENEEDYEEAEDSFIWKCPSLNENENFNSWDIHNNATFNLINNHFRLFITSKIIDDIDIFIKKVDGLVNEG